MTEQDRHLAFVRNLFMAFDDSWDEVDVDHLLMLLASHGYAIVTFEPDDLETLQ